jgi:hypothetical protein
MTRRRGEIDAPFRRKFDPTSIRNWATIVKERTLPRNMRLERLTAISRVTIPDEIRMITVKGNYLAPWAGLW